VGRQTNFQDRLRWLLSIAAVTYIAFIGIFAIEEIKARDDGLALIAARQADVAAELALTPAGAEGRGALERRRDTLAGLRTRLSVLVIDGSVPLEKSHPGTLKEIMCELAAVDDPGIACPVPDDGWARNNIAPHLFLKSLSEHSGTGEVLAVLIITAAFGGALIRTSLESTGAGTTLLVLKTLLRAIGGGIVCCLIVVGGNLPASGAGLKNTSGPATASLLGLLAGMFSDRMFELLTELVQAFVEKLRPRPSQKEAAGGADAKPVVAMDPVER
jgi:hypothetical protein